MQKKSSDAKEKQRLRNRREKMNKAIVMGNLVRDPEIITTTNGKEVAKFTIAAQKNYANEEGKKDADFIDCQAWDEKGKAIAKYFHKGDKILVIGRIEKRKYEKDGENKSVTVVTVESFEFVNLKKKEEKELTEIEDDGSLPF